MTTPAPLPVAPSANYLALDESASSNFSGYNEMPEFAFFEFIAQSYYQDLFRFAFSLTHREEDSADLVQQVFTTWARKGHQLRDRTKVKSWLFTTLHREFIYRYRLELRGPVRLDNPETHSEKVVSFEPRIDREIDGKLILGALDLLEEPYGESMRLFFVSELNYREIAETLHVAIGTVMSRLSRGKALMRKQLERPLSA